MTLYETITAAVSDITRHGFQSVERVDYWMAQIRVAAQTEMVPEAQLQEQLRRHLGAVFHREIEQGGLAKRHPEVSRYTVENLRPAYRAELDRRVMASAQLIRLNRAGEMERTLRRFSGWASSIPAGGSDVVDKVEVKTNIYAPIQSLSFRERRVAIDQGHKFVSSLSEITATNGGAIAAIWQSHWRQRGYNYRPDHKERDEVLYLIRGSWAIDQGLVKRGSLAYTDEITRPGEEVSCRCSYQWVYSLSDLPDDTLTKKGRAALAEALARINQMRAS